MKGALHVVETDQAAKERPVIDGSDAAGGFSQFVLNLRKRRVEMDSRHAVDRLPSAENNIEILMFKTQNEWIVLRIG